jgi:uncharacterized protein involved in exopolysaccharide biosynthesis
MIDLKAVLRARSEVRPRPPGAWKRPWQRRGLRRYILAAVLGNVVIWTIALLVIVAWPRSYLVESSLILPSSDADARVDLKDVGQAYATSRSTYDSKSLDPRVNYKEIFLSETVLESAAKDAGVDILKFGLPRIKLIDQSSVMEIKISGSTAEQALAKSLALNKMFLERLTELRRDELYQREQAIEQAIKTSKEKLAIAQNDLVKFKVQSEIVTEKQLDEMALTTTILQKRQLELNQKLAHDKTTSSSIATQLGISAAIAGWTLTLQGDSLFLEHFKQFSTASALLTDFAHKWEDSHPKVREATGQRDSAWKSMRRRSGEVLELHLSDANLRKLAIIMQDRSRDTLLRELVSAKVSADSISAELVIIDSQRARLAKQLPTLASQSAKLEELRRRVSFSEAIFTGAVGKTDIGSANIFSSYPMVQVLVAPAIPRKVSSPKMSYVGAGAAASSIFLAVGLALAWLRKKPV